MDTDRLDTLARLLTCAESRRRFLGVLTVSMAGVALVNLTPEDTAAKDRRRRRKQRHKRRKDPGSRKGKQTGRKKQPCQSAGGCACVPNCAGTCGGAPDGCGGTCDGCGASALCEGQTCQACDVCLSGACAFTSVQRAINAAADGATLRICPGTYVEDSSRYEAVLIRKPLRLLGAGDGADATTNTIISPAQPNQEVVTINGASSVTLERLRITGGTNYSGGGVWVLGTDVALQTCTITNNTAQIPAGGIMVEGHSAVTLTDTRVTGNTGFNGGISAEYAGVTVTLDALSRVTGNTALRGLGGIYAGYQTTVELPSPDNVSGNTSFGSLPNCAGAGTFTGPGAICTTI